MSDIRSATDDARRITSGGRETIIAFATQVWVVLASIGAQSVLAWMLAPAGRGAYAVCVLFAATLAGVFSLGIDRAAQYFVMSNTQSMSSGVSVGLLTGVAGSAIAAAVGGFLIYSPLGFFQKAEPEAFWISLALVPLTIGVMVLQMQLAGQRRFARLGLIVVVQTSCNLLLIVACVRLLGLGVHGALLAQIVSSLIAFVLLVLDVRSAYRVRFLIPAWSRFREVFSYGLRYYPASIGNMIDLGLGTFVIAMLGSREEVGFFTAASALILKVLVFADSLESVLLPRITADPKGSASLVAQCIRVSTVVTGAAVAGIVALSVPLVTILLSPAFLPSVAIIWILAPGVLVYGGAQMLMGFFRATNRPGVCSLAMWAGFVCNVLGLVVLYPTLGVHGAAAAMTLGFVSRSVVLFAAYRRATGERALDTMRFRRRDFAIVERALRRT